VLGNSRLQAAVVATLAILGGFAALVIVMLLLMRAETDVGDSVLTAVPDPVPQPAQIVREETPATAAVATFAGGCFWCTEAAFQETPGGSNAVSGYAGGAEIDPTYEAVYTGRTGHREAVQVYYDPAVVTFPDLLQIYWRSIDPTDAGGQFVDRGLPYTTAVFYRDEAQRAAAEQSRTELSSSQRFDEPIATQILPFTTFYEAEDYHQDFYLKSPDRYLSYEAGSGREAFKAQVWEEIQQGS
jgi:peptide methionine sulfoxide reductase msrA/msrB